MRLMKWQNSSRSFIDQCENFFTLRPLSDVELIGTINSVLKGPAWSWWLAARDKITNWVQFKSAFLEAFLPYYPSEMEDQIRASVQAPTQCLRDFAYDHRVLCLKWRSDMPEDELVRRILSACNPKLASGLCGIVSTVEQLVKVGSLIEKDWGNSKDYWSHVQQNNPMERNPRKNWRDKKPDQGQGRGQSADLASVLGAPTLLVMPLAIRGSKGDAVLDTGCTYSLMCRTLWNNIKKTGEALCEEHQKFVMANGQESKAVGKATLLLTLNDAHYTVNVYILEDNQLCMPLLLGLDFMRTSQLTLKPHLGKYVMPGGKEHTFLQKTRDALGWRRPEPSAYFYATVVEDSSDCPPSTPLLDAQPEVVRPLLQKWSSVWTESTRTTTKQIHTKRSKVKTYFSRKSRYFGFTSILSLDSLRVFTRLF
ncbi:uncharacterized protein LOC143125720 [Alosa pseudoharengus]|uniref:uncharacterized protein LOC143125720 n=1 Tax=Alosa pseudoharengus TaxID=34774 RepID=UPI003F8B9D51